MTQSEKDKALIKALKEQLKAERKETGRFRKAYLILACYFDSISDEEQKIVAKQLSKLNL